MNIYTGNLSYDISEEDLKAAFEEFGEVTSAKIISDRYN
ncbi:MAG: RNA-binding protein, partial [Candidatus Marinimicrobia bacterium]|nr:RNA-binding protein [Candidatus Neomarinimicrobiota bacterium]